MNELTDSLKHTKQTPLLIFLGETNIVPLEFWCVCLNIQIQNHYGVWCLMMMINKCEIYWAC